MNTQNHTTFALNFPHNIPPTFFFPQTLINTLPPLLAISVFFFLNSLRTKRPHAIPSWPFIGMLPSLISAVRAGDLYEWLTQTLENHHNTFTFHGPWLSSYHGVITCDPSNIEHLLKTRFGNFPKGPYFRETVRDLLGDGIFGADHENWMRQRKVASLEFHSAKFRRMTVDSLKELVHERLFPLLDNIDYAIDLQDVLLRLTFDNVCMIAFGVDPGCLRENLPNIPFAHAFENATEATLLRFVTPMFVWRAMRFAGLGTERRLRDSILKVNQFATDVIGRRKKELNGKWCGRSDLLTVFMGMKDEDGEAAFSDGDLRDVCVNFILAGRDTSSVALSWFFWLIDRNSEAEEKVVAEIIRVCGEKEVVEAEEVKKMEYLQAAISEALRLYPSVPLDHKQVEEDDEFPDGTVLKKGTKIVYAIYAMGRMEGIWGKDCREYKPERWLGKDGRFMSESAYKFSAFNAGPRLCLGRDFAYYQMKFVAASILRRFRVKVVEGHVVKPKLALTMYMKHGLKVRLERRKEGSWC